uniref:Formin-like protein n=1 Tax=Clastoptera arizonana TaxID=38151 RepID=A0A1B6DWK9_9HEMI
MGNSQNTKMELPPRPVDLQRSDNGRASIRSKLPMPTQVELENKFTKVLASMDLPPDKARVLRQYDNEKKWDIICDQERVQAKDPPSHYLNKLRTYLDPKASRSSRKRKIVGDATSTQVLKDLEISLRTNHIEWVREFLNEQNLGLDSLVDYLSFRLIMLRQQQRISESRSSSEERLATINNSPPGTTGVCSAVSIGLNGTSSNRPTLDALDSPGMKKRYRHAAKLKMGDAKDDIHVCIMCLRAIMNNKYGFNMVIRHTEAINSIALSLVHKSLRTKALVLELLAAICLVKGGHEIILSAFDNFKEVCHEKKRFQTLMDYFINYEVFHIEFMVACMQFVNIIVHSVEDMNFRVHLQYEFTKLGLDEYLEKLRHTESEELQVQISAYLDNVFDVAALMEDSETKTAALEKVAELEDELGHAHDRLVEVERESLAQLATLESALGEARAELDQKNEEHKRVEEEVQTLRRVVNDQKQESQSRLSMLEEKIQELKSRDSSSSSGVSSYSTSSTSSCGSTTVVSSPVIPPPPPLVPVVAPPPPPPPPGLRPGGPIPPPPAGMMQAPEGAMTIKRKVQTKHKLPMLNWVALKPNQVRGTIFIELDDNKLHSIIDFADFEERFKLPGSGVRMANGNIDVGDGLSSYPSKRFKKPENISLLEHTRLRNIAISRRKLEMSVEKVIVAVNALDLKQLSLENVEILQRMVPNEQESKAYREYIAEKKDINILTEEDKFLMQLAKVERLSNKLAIMAYMGNFLDNVHIITPQVQAVMSASSSVKSSKKFRRVLEIVLAFGNYMNSSKRGPAYGFKLQSLDTLMDTKSSDKRMSLLQYIVATIKDKFPDLKTFDTELLYIEKAATVSLEIVISDVSELEKGMELVRKESEVRRERTNPTVLRDFLANSEDKLRKLKTDAKIAQDLFRECLEYFGESPRSSDANTFFSLLVRFTKSYKTAEQENEQRRRLELAAAEASNNSNNIDVAKRNKINQKKQQEAVINELKNKTRLVQEKKLLHQDDVYNGALEDILLGLKSEPYRRADAVRRSQRRRIDNNRLSRTMEELDV